MSQSFSPEPRDNLSSAGGNSVQHSANTGNVGNADMSYASPTGGQPPIEPPIFPPKLTPPQIPAIPQTQIQATPTHIQTPPYPNATANTTANAAPTPLQLPTPGYTQTQAQTHAPTQPQPYGQMPLTAPVATSTPTVPMHVYRELAAELQSTKAMLEAIQQQNQRLSQQNLHLTQQNQQFQAEMVNVVNAALSMRQTAESFQAPPEQPREVKTDQPIAPLPPVIDASYVPSAPHSSPSGSNGYQNGYPGRSGGAISPSAPPSAPQSPVIPLQLTRSNGVDYPQSPRSEGFEPGFNNINGINSSTNPNHSAQSSAQSLVQSSAQPQNPGTRLYTEQPGGYERWGNAGEEPGERSGLWLLVAIVATIVTAFGAGYWLVRPLLNSNPGR